MNAKSTLFALLVVLFSLALFGCAGTGKSGVNCSDTTNTYTITPASATSDHRLAGQGSQVKFNAQFATLYPKGCAVPELVMAPFGIWTSSDPINIIIDSSQGETNGLATCVGATNGAATLTAKSSTLASALTATATLTCQ